MGKEISHLTNSRSRHVGITDNRQS